MKKGIYNLAFFWKCSPLEIKQRTLSEIAEMNEHALRISDEIKEAHKPYRR